MLARAGNLALALLIGFLVYRVALMTQPSRDRMVNTSETGVSLAPISVAVQFDPVTGFPNSPDHSYLTPIDGWQRALSHWLGSLLLGLAVAVIAAWWLARRRRQRSAPAGIATTLAFALWLGSCGGSGGVPSSNAVVVSLKTIDVSEESGSCVLMYSIVDVAADPTYGTIDRTSGNPLTWPSGYTARWAGTEVQVLNPAGNVVLTTGQRYRISPMYKSFPDGPTAVCAPSPCHELAPSDSSSYVRCKLGESGPL